LVFFKLLLSRKTIFPLASVPRPSDAHPPSCTIGTGGPFPGLKRCREVTLTTHPHLVPRSIISSSYTSSPTWRLCDDGGTVLFIVEDNEIWLLVFKNVRRGFLPLGYNGKTSYTERRKM
jgi:hypothetical protein